MADRMKDPNAALTGHKGELKEAALLRCSKNILGTKNPKTEY